MPNTVEVAIPVEVDAAAALADERKWAAVGRIISRPMQPTLEHDPLLQAMRRLGAEAAAKGITPERLEAELAARKRERERRSSLTRRCLSARRWRPDVCFNIEARFVI